MISVQSLLPHPTGSLLIPALEANSTSPRSIHTGTVRFSLIVPTYNEGQNIQLLIQQLSCLLDQAVPQQYELIVVDDDSPDGTWEKALELVATYPYLRVVRRQQERGLSTAVIRGWQVAQGEVLGVIDGDLQHPPEVLVQLLQAIEQGADLAVASRNVMGGGVSDWSPMRRLLSRGAQVLGLLILPGVVGRVSDPMSGYFLVRRAAVANKLLSPVGYKILLEVLGRGDVERVAEVGYVFQERQEGKSKVTWKQYVEYLLHLWRLRGLSQLRGQVQMRGQVRRQDRQRGQQQSIPLIRFFRFGVVGLSGVLVDMALLYWLSDPAMLGLGLTRSKIIASEIAIVNNFLWNDLWTFGDISCQQKGRRKRLKRLLKFNLICLAGLILNVLILNLLFNVFGINRYLANLLAIGAVTIWNFWLNLKLSWRVTDAKGEMRER